jgi:putative oxidoreductase
MTIGLLILRGVIGALFVGHWVQKLFGWLGGHGIEGTAGFMDSLRYRNGRVAALLAGLAETVGGLALILGLLTPLAAAAIIGVMVNAVATVHLRNGLWNTNGGIELPLVYAAAATALAFAGPGSFSLDAALGLDLTGVVYGVWALVLGTAVALAALAWRRREAADQPEEMFERIAP